jgi:small conductance mechanosensitive channel
MIPANWDGEVAAFLTQLASWAAVAIPSVIGAVLLVAAGWWLAARADGAIGGLLDRQTRIDPTLRGVVTSVVRYAILILAAVAALAQIGVQTTSILAVLGAAGLAIGLAMQGTLANIAAGIMLLWLRPFKVGDYIEAGPIAGTVKEVGLFASELHTGDGLFLFVPNAQLWNVRIVNYSRLATRQVELQFGISYGDDLAKGRHVLIELAASDARVQQEPAPETFVHELGDSAVVLALRVWTANGDYWPVRRDFLERGKLALEAAGLSIPFPQREVHLRPAPQEPPARAA